MIHMYSRIYKIICLLFFFFFFSLLIFILRVPVVWIFAYLVNQCYSFVRVTMATASVPTHCQPWPQQKEVLTDFSPTLNQDLRERRSGSSSAMISQSESLLCFNIISCYIYPHLARQGDLISFCWWDFPNTHIYEGSALPPMSYTTLPTLHIVCIFLSSLHVNAYYLEKTSLWDFQNPVTHSCLLPSATRRPMRGLHQRSCFGNY